MQLAGNAVPGRPWRVGISDPHDRSRLLTSVAGRDFAVATSGSSERGEHITNPYTATAARSLASVTVVGPSITRADVYATAAVAIGSPAVTWLDSLPGHHGLVVFDDNTVVRTSRFDEVTDDAVRSSDALSVSSVLIELQQRESLEECES